MQINNLAEYLANILNIKMDNPYIIDDMLEELEQINDLKSFKDFVKERSNTESYKFLTGYQKFLKAISDFKTINSSVSEDKVETYCKKLIEKIRTVVRAVDESLPSGLRFNDFAETATFDKFRSGGNCAFDEKEQRLLSEVGTCKVWLLTYDSHPFLIKLINAVKKLNKLHLAPPVEKTLKLEDIAKRIENEKI